MAYANGNYAAFYVSEPFTEGGLGANATKDFVYYNLLKAWKVSDSEFPFINSHDKTYNVRDGSDWESTLKPRLRERLRNSKNIILFLSQSTKSSQALREEIDYGINSLGLPVIVIYPDYKTNDKLLSNNCLIQDVKDLWDKLPKFRDSMSDVPTLHIPMNKELIEKALKDTGFMKNSKRESGVFIFRN
ncbi:TIR domain-containing protein [Aeromonas sp. ASNIH5]|uniref:TIR domain-containing protein n=1 Tax=Aeromonas sp. ASNIH5 TaxID=1758179 RepID=UPI000CD2A125|nr:TIR domain-containing protein [Aeromonas sp. ASNIH5]AUT43614.1 hypothetical protein C2U30_19375 [Aeromonas sp. ASNIH5]